MRRDSLDTRPITSSGSTSMSGRTDRQWAAIRSTTSSSEPAMEQVYRNSFHVKYLYINILYMKLPDYHSTLALTLLAPISWGTTYITITEFLPPDRPLTVAAARVLPAGVLLALFGMARSRWLPRGREFRNTAIVALFNFALFFPLLIFAIYRMPGGVAAAIGGVQPLFVATLTWTVTRSRPRTRDLVIGAAAAVGVALIVGRPGAHFDAVGVFAALAANLSFSMAVVLTKHLPTPSDRVGSVGWQMILSSIVLVPLAALAEGPLPPIGLAEVAGFAYLTLFATGVAFLLWFSGIRRLPATAPPLLGLAAPITGATLGWIVLGESLTPTQLLGFVTTISAITLGVAHRRVAEPPEATIELTRVPPDPTDDERSERRFIDTTAVGAAPTLRCA